MPLAYVYSDTMTYVNLGKHKGKKRHVNTVTQREAGFKRLLYGPEWSHGFRHFSVGMATLPSEGQVYLYDRPPTQLEQTKLCCTNAP